MKNHNPIIFVILILVTSCTTDTEKAKPNHWTVPELYAPVNDYSDVLSETEEAELNQMILAYHDSVGPQMAIFIVKSLGPQTIEEFSFRAANTYQLGRADYDDGILITVATENRVLRVEVGDGLEFIITDVIAKQIIDSCIIPQFRAGDFAAGLKDAILDIIFRIDANRYFIGKKWSGNI